ncbi:MAG: amidohydrolase [Blautia sp.]|jgi:amidohydrolase
MIYDTLQGYVHEIYRHLHSIPEKAMEEYRTSQFLAEKLCSFGFSVEEHVGGTGIIGVLDSKVPGRVIALRADMDALTYEIDGRVECRHTCGHDAHSAIVLTAARDAAKKGIASGKLVILFQPGEEPILGALAMIASKKLDVLGIEELYGLHVRAVDERDCRFGFMSPAVFTSASGRLRVKFKRTRECSGNVVNAAVLAIHAVNMVHMDPTIRHSLKTTHLTMEEGRQGQIPDRAEMIVDCKHLSTPLYHEMKEKATKAIEKAAAAAGVSVSVESIEYVPGGTFDEETIAIARRAIIEELGEEHCSPVTYFSAGDDFNYFVEYLKCRAVYMGLGADASPGLHHQDMKINCSCLDNGVKVMENIIGQRLGYQKEA